MANIKDLLGDKYQDGMTVEELLSTDLGNLVDKSQFDGFVSKETLDKATKDASEWKKKYRDTLDESERAKAEQEELNKSRDERLATLEREKSISELKSNFLAQGYNEELAISSATAMLDNDQNTLFSNMAKFNADKEQQFKSQKQNETPKPPVGNTTKQKEVDTSTMSPYEYIQYQNSLAAEQE